MARGGARPGAGRPARKSANTFPSLGACARPRARGGRKSKTVYRPVKWICERREAFLTDFHGRDLASS
jgi:hypothetical protein